MNYDDRQQFRLGKEVNFALPVATLKPSREEMKTAAEELNISQAAAWKAWNLYTWVTP